FYLLFISLDLHSETLYTKTLKLINYIASENFHKLRETTTDFERIDSIFGYALTICNNDYSDALKICAIGTIPYTEFQVITPILKFKFDVFIFKEIDKYLHMSMVNNLPEKFFDDSPNSIDSDKDKLPHFFGSAYLSYNINKSFSLFVGSLVERLEAKFKIDSKIDERDLRMNYIGAEFGELLEKELIYPSIILSKNKKLTQ
ncbi:MAG: hypothetical protein N3A61_02315, partial [Ignavibacteria bacterium]|nr:hypothetical protein [Ignavibacteria bacterium]